MIILHSQMLPHILNEIGRLLSVGQLLQVGQARFDRRRVRQFLFGEMPTTFRSERLVRTVGERRRHFARRHRHRREVKILTFPKQTKTWLRGKLVFLVRHIGIIFDSFLLWLFNYWNLKKNLLVLLLFWRRLNMNHKIFTFFHTSSETSKN